MSNKLVPIGADQALQRGFAMLDQRRLDETSFPPGLLRDGAGTRSGVSVNTTSSLMVAAVFCAVRVISEGIAQLPIQFFRSSGGNRKPADDLDIANLLAHTPNDWMTGFELREMMTMHAALTGDGFAFINRRKGRVLEIVPLLPNQVTVTQSEQHVLGYEVDNGSGAKQRYSPNSILHLRGPLWNGYIGLPVMEMARESLGLAIAMRNSQAKYYRSGQRPSGVLSADTAIAPEKAIKVRDQWNDRFGPDGEGGIALLDQGVKYQALQGTAVDSQLAESQEHQINEIARMFRVYPQMLMQPSKTSTYASAEQFFLAHVTHTLMPWAIRWEQVINRDLLAGTDGAYTKLNFNALLRGTIKDRSEAYAKAITNGWMTRNEVRALEDLDPIDGLDEPLVPLNMTTPGASDSADPQEDDS